MKVFPNVKHPAPLQLGNIIHVDIFLYLIWRKRGYHLTEYSHGLTFSPDHGDGPQRSVWISKGHSVM